MASANAVANSGKNSSFGVGGGGNSGRSRMQVQNCEIQRRQWIPDERDNFMSWLRGEFAAANAIIDSLCQHLRIVGEPGEYDFVLSCIQQRRCNWTVVLHMQQYFSVAEVLYAIQQVAWRKQQRKSDYSAGSQINPLLNGKDNVYSHVDRHGSAHPGNANFAAQSVKKSGQRVSLTRNGSKDEGFVSGGAYVGKKENTDASNEAQLYDALSANTALQSGEGLDSLSGSAMGEFEKTKSSSLSELAEKGKQEKETKHECQVQAEPEIGGSIATDKQESLENRGSNLTEKHELEVTESKFSSSEQNDTSRKGRRLKAADSNPARPKAMDGACSTHQSVSGAAEDILTNLDFRFVSKQEDDRRRSMIKVSKNFVGNELVEGKMVNIVEGLELYENIFNSSELSRLTLLTQKLKVAGRRRELKGQTFVVFKRPMKGHGREMIQFGVPSIDAPLEEEIKTGRVKDSVEPIPVVLQDVINRLLRWQIIPENTRPDSCIINFFNEGDHSQPHISPAHFVRPFWTISLVSECTMVFGRAITINHPGDYKGPLKLSLPSGSLIVMQGNSADISKYSICSSPGQRVSITFVKVQPKKGSALSAIPTGTSHSSSLSNSHWSQPAARQSSTNASVPVPRVGQMATKHYNMVPTSGVLPVPPAHTSQVNQRLPAPGIQPLFAGPTGPPGAYPPMAVIPPVWSAVPRPTPRMPGSGTGVFLPCSGSGSGSGQLVSLPQQQQGLPDTSPGLPINEQSFTLPASTESPATSCSTSELSKMAAPNQLAFDSLDMDSERSNAILSSQTFPAKIDFAVPKTAPNKDLVNKSPKSDSNTSKMTKGDQWNRVSSQSKRSANKLNSTNAGGSS